MIPGDEDLERKWLVLEEGGGNVCWFEAVTLF